MELASAFVSWAEDHVVTADTEVPWVHYLDERLGSALLQLAPVTTLPGMTEACYPCLFLNLATQGLNLPMRFTEGSGIPLLMRVPVLYLGWPFPPTKYDYWQVATCQPESKPGGCHVHYGDALLVEKLPYDLQGVRLDGSVEHFKYCDSFEQLMSVLHQLNPLLPALSIEDLPPVRRTQVIKIQERYIINTTAEVKSLTPNVVTEQL